MAGNYAHTTSAQLPSSLPELARHHNPDPLRSSIAGISTANGDSESKAPLGEFMNLKKPSGSIRRRRERDAKRNRRQKTPGVWKKILWVKQSCKIHIA
jgi:hypothetical protein